MLGKASSLRVAICSDYLEQNVVRNVNAKLAELGDAEVVAITHGESGHSYGPLVNVVAEEHYSETVVMIVYRPTPQQVETEKASEERRQLLIKRISAINHAWKAAPEDTDPRSFDWCGHLLMSDIDLGATAKRRDAEGEGATIWMVLVDGTELWLTRAEYEERGHWEQADI